MDEFIGHLKLISVKYEFMSSLMVNIAQLNAAKMGKAFADVVMSIW